MHLRARRPLRDGAPGGHRPAQPGGGPQAGEDHRLRPLHPLYERPAGELLQRRLSGLRPLSPDHL